MKLWILFVIFFISCRADKVLPAEEQSNQSSWKLYRMVSVGEGPGDSDLGWDADYTDQEFFFEVSNDTVREYDSLGNIVYSSLFSMRPDSIIVRYEKPRLIGSDRVAYAWELKNDTLMLVENYSFFQQLTSYYSRIRDKNEHH